jgi:hypothetical protein
MPTDTSFPTGAAVALSMCGGALAANAWMSGHASLVRISCVLYLLTAGCQNMSRAVDTNEALSNRTSFGFFGTAQIVTGYILALRPPSLSISFQAKS